MQQQEPEQQQQLNDLNESKGSSNQDFQGCENQYKINSNFQKNNKILMRLANIKQENHNIYQSQNSMSESVKDKNPYDKSQNNANTNNQYIKECQQDSNIYQDSNQGDISNDSLHCNHKVTDTEKDMEIHGISKIVYQVHRNINFRNKLNY